MKLILNGLEIEPEPEPIAPLTVILRSKLEALPDGKLFTLAELTRDDPRSIAGSCSKKMYAYSVKHGTSRLWGNPRTIREYIRKREESNDKRKRSAGRVCKVRRGD